MIWFHYVVDGTKRVVVTEATYNAQWQHACESEADGGSGQAAPSCHQSSLSNRASSPFGCMCQLLAQTRYMVVPQPLHHSVSYFIYRNKLP